MFKFSDGVLGSIWVFLLFLAMNLFIYVFGLSSSLVGLIAAAWGAYVLFKHYPIQASLSSYLIVLAVTGFVAGIGIESGAYLSEVDAFGVAGYSFSKLFIFYFLFFCFFVFGCKGIDDKKPNAPIFLKSSKAVWVGVLISAITVLSGLGAGLDSGFAYIEEVNRYAIRSEAEGVSAFLFNFYLNNRVFLAIFLGACIYSVSIYVRYVAIILIGFSVILSVLHGEQFMATVQLCLTVLIPIVLIQKSRDAINYKVVSAILILSTVIGFFSIYFAYLAQGFDAELMFSDRLLLQSQVWYVIDRDAGPFSPPSVGGWGAFQRVVLSLFDSEAPSYLNSFDKISGLREVMYSYGIPELVETMSERNVTFTMGQMGIPVYWFGKVLGLAFICATGLLLGKICKWLVSSIFFGGFFSIWIAAKIYSNSMFGIQQGEYWYLFSVRALFFIMAFLVVFYHEKKYLVGDEN